MDLQLKGKNVLITGATNGLGLRTARLFADEGANLGFCSIDGDKRIDEVAGELTERGVTAWGTGGDVTVPSDAERVVAEVADALGGIDILINNVGKRSGGTLFEATDEDWRKTFESIIFQAVRMIRLTVPHMRKRGGGAIVNISSVSGWQPQLAKGSQYGAAKAGLIFLAEPLALELSADKIRVNTVSPGSMNSPDGIWEKWGQKNPGGLDTYISTSFPMGRMGTPEDVAEVIVFVASPRAGWLNGRHIPVDGLQQPVPAPGYKNW